MNSIITPTHNLRLVRISKTVKKFYLFRRKITSHKLQQMFLKWETGEPEQIWKDVEIINESET